MVEAKLFATLTETSWAEFVDKADMLDEFAFSGR